MKENFFEMGAKFEDSWTSDNKDKPSKNKSLEIKLPEKHHLHFAKEKRRGKVVTIIKPFYLEKQELQALLKILKKKLGIGGTVKEDNLEFQGEVSDTLRTHLESLGYRFKK